MTESIPTRYVYCGLAWLFLALAAIGVFTPLLPTAPLFLVAAWLFAKSSERWKGWLFSSPFAGRELEMYRKFGVVNPTVKRGALLAIWLSLAASCLAFSGGVAWTLYAFGGLGVTLTMLIVRLPSSREDGLPRAS